MTVLTKAPLEQEELLSRAVDAYRALSPGSIDWANWDNRTITGSLPTTEENLELARSLKALLILMSTADLAVLRPDPDGTIDITLALVTLRSKRGYFARDLESMLVEWPEFCFDPPSSYFLAEGTCARGGYHHPTEQNAAPEQIVYYGQAMQLATALEHVSDHVIPLGSEKTLLFSSHGTLTVSMTYGAGDLRDLEEGDDGPDAASSRQRRRLTAFVDLLTSGTHVARTHDILVTSILEEFALSKVSLADIIGRFDQIYRRFTFNYQAYVSEFSFEKVRAEADERRLRYIDEMNSIFSSIQNRLLTIPLALIVVASQMESGATFTNGMIVLGSMAFAGLMLLLIGNQRVTLSVLKSEIDRECRKVSQYSDIKDELLGVYAELGTRYRRHQRQLWWIGVLVALSLAVTVGAFFYFL